MPLNVAIVGIGYVGMKYLDAAQRHPEMRIFALAGTERSKERLETLKAEYGARFTTTDYDEIVASDDVDLVILGTPNHLHAEQALKAFAGDKHLLIEKPMVTTLEDCRRLIHAERGSKSVALVGQICRFSPIFMTIKSLSEERLGDVFFVEGDYIHNIIPWLDGLGHEWWNHPENPHFAVMGGGCHPVDLMRWVAGDVEEVFAYGNRFSWRDNPYEDTVIASLKFRSGCAGKLFVSLSSPRPYGLNLSVYGTKGTVINNRLFTTDIPNLEDFVDLPITIDEEHPYFYEELDHLVSCIKGEATPKVSVLEGAKTVSTCLAMGESLDTGAPVKVVNDLG